MFDLLPSHTHFPDNTRILKTKFGNRNDDDDDNNGGNVWRLGKTAHQEMKVTTEIYDFLTTQRT